ncbi:MAG: cytochrome c biogenesis protein CcdA, partial [Pseudomonadota bacterium]
MTLEFSSIPLAALAGALSILSPCVWPLVPAVMSSAATGGKTGPWFLAAGLSISFAVAGTILTFVLLNLGLDPEIMRIIAAVLLLFMAAVLLI